MNETAKELVVETTEVRKLPVLLHQGKIAWMTGKEARDSNVSNQI